MHGSPVLGLSPRKPTILALLPLNYGRGSQVPLEPLATQIAAAERLERERGIKVPVKCFSNQADRSTFAFNPMTQPFWDNFDLLTRTDILPEPAA